jgi:hypothetical protein
MKNQSGYGDSTANRFEIDSVWVPSLDEVAESRRMLLRTKPLSWFERLGIYAAMVLIASSVGSQNNFPLFNGLLENTPVAAT